MKHESSVYAYIRSLIPKRNDAEDVLQETCMTLWRKFDQFEPDSDFVRWALRVAKYEVLNFRRRQRRAGLQFSDEFFNALAGESQEECRRLDGGRKGVRNHYWGKERHFAESWQRMKPRSRPSETKA